MRAEHRHAVAAALVTALLGVLGGSSTATAQEGDCSLRLEVVLSPDVPNPEDEGFLSSLLNNHLSYRLELLRQQDSSIIELELQGPGPEYRCQNVIETMRRDARIEAIRVESSAMLASR